MTTNPFPPELREGLLLRAIYQCERGRLAGREHCAGELEVHHRVTRSRGGPHDPFNCVVLCGYCHHRVAHGMNLWPWYVRGAIGAEGYVGEDTLFQRVYLPSRRELSDAEFDLHVARIVSAGFPLELAEWSVYRARDALALGEV